MAHEPSYYRRCAAEARSAACHKDDRESVEVAGHLALAYAALARSGSAVPRPDAPDAVDHVAASAADPVPLMLQD